MRRDGNVNRSAGVACWRVDGQARIGRRVVGGRVVVGSIAKVGEMGSIRRSRARPPIGPGWVGAGSLSLHSRAETWGWRVAGTASLLQLSTRVHFHGPLLSRALIVLEFDSASQADIAMMVLGM